MTRGHLPAEQADPAAAYNRQSYLLRLAILHRPPAHASSSSRRTDPFQLSITRRGGQSTEHASELMPVSQCGCALTRIVHLSRLRLVCHETRMSVLARGPAGVTARRPAAFQLALQPWTGLNASMKRDDPMHGDLDTYPACV